MDESKKYSTGYLIKRILGQYVRPQLPRILLAVFFMMIYAGSHSAQPLLLEYIFDDVFNAKDDYYIKIIPLAVIAVFVTQGMSNFFSNYISEKVSFSVVELMQKKLFSKFINFDISMHSATHSGDFISRIVFDINFIGAICSKMLIAVVKNGLTLLGLIAVMIHQSPELTGIAVLVFFFAFFPILRIAKRLRKLAKQTQGQSSSLMSKLQENFQGIRLIKAYQKEQEEEKRVFAVISEFVDLRLKSIKVGSLSSPIIEAMAGVTIALMIWYGAGVFTDSGLTSGELVAFTAAFIMASRPIRAMAGLNQAIQNAMSASERYFTMLDKNPEVVNAEKASELKVQDAKIEFKDVTFKYDQDGQEAVQRVSFRASKNQKVALVGHSGSGKSTIFNLLLRFYDPNSGQVMIDGQDIKDATIESLRKNIALVTQEVFLFDDSVKKNIAFGKEDATGEEIEAAAKAAAAHDFISSLPEGYETNVGQYGSRLSGGQRQRIAIARAFLRNAPILLLDEATSALDPKSEKEINAAVSELIKDKTTFIIAHRLSTVRDADLIYVLNKGEIVGSGTHDELIQENEYYRKLFEI